MNSQDQALITIVCVGIIALPIIALIFTFIARRRRGASTSVDNANIIPTDDGLLIKPHRMFNIMGIIIIGGFALLMLALFFNMPSSTGVWAVRVIAALLLVVVWRMIVGLFKPSIEINRRQQHVNIGRRQIPFAQLAGIAFSYSEPRVMRGQAQPVAYGSVSLMLHDASSLQLLTLSGMNTPQRANDIGAMVAEKIGGQALRTRFTDNQQVANEDGVAVVRFYFDWAKGE